MMRMAAVFASVVMLLWCSAAVLRLPVREIPWPIPVYVVAQFLFAMTAFLGLQRGSETAPETDAWYKVFFLATFSAVLLLALIVTGRLLCAYPPAMALIVIFGSVGLAVGVSGTVYYQLLKLYKSHVPPGYAGLTIQGAILLGCGFATLMCAIEPSAPSLHTASLWLAIFWLLNGVYFFSYMLGFTRTIGVKWDNINWYVPPMLAAVCFGAMAFNLSGQQAETAQQSVLSDRVQVMEVTQ